MMNATDLLRGALRAFLGVLLLWWLGSTAFAQSISLTGSNGREVEFAGIRDAAPQGLTVQMTPEGQLIGIPWQNLDLEALKQRHPGIHAAYEATKTGETIALNLGTYSGEPMRTRPISAVTGVAEPEVRQGRWPGWTDTKIGNVTFLMQMPMGTPRGILLFAAGDDGHSFQYLMGHELGRGLLGQLQAKHRLVLLSYEFGDRNLDPTELPEFARVEKESGAQILLAVDRIADQLNRPELKELPYAIYGRDRVGASVAYHFVQWRPDRVLAAVISKGAFYEAPPRDVATEVPVLFIEGQYNNLPEVWQSEKHFHSVFANELVAKSNWTFATEFRAGGEPTPNSEYLGMKYLEELIELRFPPEIPPAPPKKEGEEDEEKEEEAEPKPSIPELSPLDRSKGFVGDLEEMETSKLADTDAPLEEGKTFIPTSDTARLWKGFVDGTLEPRIPGREE